MPNSKKFVAEFRGTFGLILYGAGAALQQQMTQAVGVTGIAVAHGLAILVGIYALGHISGGHFNPAVTMGFLVTRRFSFRTTLLYWVAQLLGGVVAAWIPALVYTNGIADAHLGAPVADPRSAPRWPRSSRGIAASCSCSLPRVGRGPARPQGVRGGSRSGSPRRRTSSWAGF